MRTAYYLLLALSVSSLALGKSTSPKFEFDILTASSIETAKQDLLNTVNPYERNLLLEAFDSVDTYAEMHESLEVWSFLNGKVPIEIFQHAVLLDHERRSKIWIEAMTYRVAALRKEASDESLPIKEREDLSRIADEEEKTIEAVRVVGVPILRGDDVGCKGYWTLRDAQMKSIKGKWHALLFDRLKDADRIEIVSTRFGSIPHGQTLHTIHGNDKVLEFLKLADIDEAESGFHCMCDGDGLLVFYEKENRITELSYHHGRSLRWNDGSWIGDAAISEDKRSKLLDWFSALGYPTFKEANEND